MEWYDAPFDADAGDQEESTALHANIRALNVIIGLLSRHYPERLAPQYIRECVQHKQYNELARNEDDALSFMSSVYGADLFCQLVNLFEELDAKEEAAAKSQQEKASAAISQRSEARTAKAAADKKPTEKKTQAKKTPAKKAPAKKAPEMKTGGAADGT